jgi:dethiobiotin synthetase
MHRHCAVAVVGTDTGVGKTRVGTMLARGLRSLARVVWVHKPIACGDWSCGMADDGRQWAGLVADGQPPATACPFQFPEPASPHLAAGAAGRPVALAELHAGLRAVTGDHDLVVEGAGGLLTPLSAERATIADLLAGSGIALLVVTRPDLGTLNHTALTVACARSRGLPLLGLVVNRPRAVPAGLATAHAVSELMAITGLPALADLAHGEAPAGADAALASAVLAAAARARQHPAQP